MNNTQYIVTQLELTRLLLQTEGKYDSKQEQAEAITKRLTVFTPPEEPKRMSPYDIFI